MLYFPEENKYNIVEPIIKWLPEERQIKIIKAIPEVHQPIFWWLKYHLRRPSEAMALHRKDYLKDEDAFHIRRTFSAKQLIEQTKTKRQHLIPYHSEFKKIMVRMPVNMSSPFFFVNPYGKLADKHYQHDYLVDLWHRACQKVGEDIDMYSGLKHSSCSQYINEKHYSLDQLQMLTDHQRRESLRKYAVVTLDEKRRLLEGKQGRNL
jgi:integrase